MSSRKTAYLTDDLAATWIRLPRWLHYKEAVTLLIAHSIQTCSCKTTSHIYTQARIDEELTEIQTSHVSQPADTVFL